MTGKLGDGPRTNSKEESHCFHCGAADHWAYECPELTGDQQGQLHINLQAQNNAGGGQEEEGHQLLNITLTQGGALPNNRAYIDGCSTVMAFKNDKYLKGVKKVREGIKINCNAGLVTTNLKGNYGRLKVWYVPKGIANIFSMHELKRLYHITYDSWDGYNVVHTPRGEVKFHKDKQGLPYINLDELDEEATVLLIQMMEQQDKEKEDSTKEGVMLVQTMRGNYEGFTKQEVIKAQEAREAQTMLGNPSKKDFQGLVSGNLIPNCPIMRGNISNACNFFWPDLASIHGKTVQRMPAPVVADYVAIPQQLVDANKAVTLAADMFFMDGIAFLITVSRRIKFITTKHLPVRMATSLSKHLQRVLLVYGRAGFRVKSILMDGECKKVKGLMPMVECNTTAAKEHVSKAKRSIRTVKEHTKGIVTMLPFTHIPWRMKIEFVYFTVLWLNAFPVKTGISSTYLLQEILVRWRLDYKNIAESFLEPTAKSMTNPTP
jgi:hypothetical protein